MKLLLFLFLLPAAFAEDFYISSSTTVIGKVSYLTEKAPRFENLILDVIDDQLPKATTGTKTDNPLEKVFQSHYYFGVNEVVEFKFSAIDYPEIFSDDLAERICLEVKCDFLYKGPELLYYVPSTRWQRIFKFAQKEKNLMLLYKENQVAFSNLKDNKIKTDLINSTLPEMIYLGVPGKVMHYKARLVDANRLSLQTSGTYLMINGKIQQVMKKLLKDKDLQTLVEASNADCGFSGNLSSFYRCTTDVNSNQMIEPQEWPQELSLKYWNGDATFFFNKEHKDDLGELLVKSVPPHVAYESQKIELYMAKNSIAKIFHTHKSDYHLPNIEQYKNVKITYLKKNSRKATSTFRGLDSETRKRVHEIILDTTEADIFTVHHLVKGDEKLVGRFQVKNSTPREISAKRSRMMPNLLIDLDFETRYLKATAPPSYTYMARADRKDLSPSFVLEYWPKNKGWGVRATAQEFVNRYSDGTAIEKKGRNREYSLTQEYRLINIKPSFRYDFKLGFGGKVRYFLIQESATLKNFRFYQVVMRAAVDVYWAGLIFTGGFAFNPIFKTSQQSTPSNPWDSSFGFEQKFELNVKKKINPWLYFQLKSYIQLTDVRYDSEKLDINERGVSFGFHFPLRY
jgi:hypothetical protein